MQVGVPSGKNTARFRGDEGESIMNTNILLRGKNLDGIRYSQNRIDSIR
jgi:hypothetical protein